MAFSVNEYDSFLAAGAVSPTAAPPPSLEFVGRVVHAKRPFRLPVVMSREEVEAVLEQVSGTWHLMASLLRGPALRPLRALRSPANHGTGASEPQRGGPLTPSR